MRSPSDVNVVVPGKKASDNTDVELPHGKPKSYSVISLLCLPCVMELSTTLFCLKFVRNCLYMWLPLYFLEYLKYSKIQVFLSICVTQTFNLF